jgi:phosphoesterase RecJ-like protein
MSPSLQQVCDALRDAQSVLVVVHAGPDGDTIGSGLALARGLAREGRQVAIAGQDPVPASLAFVPGVDQIVRWAHLAQPSQWDAVVAVDCGAASRMALPSTMVPVKTLINIDHHAHNPRFGDINWIEPDAAATGEMVAQLYRAMGWPMSQDAALALYVAISTDTLSFRQINTRSETLAVASELTQAGFDLAEVNQKLWEHQNVHEVRLLGWALTHLQLSPDGRIAWLSVERAVMQSFGVHDATVDTLVHHLRAIDTVTIAVVLKELADGGWVKVSWRGKQGFDVAQYAARFGGGGHRYAAAAIVPGPLATVQGQVLQALGVPL